MKIIFLDVDGVLNSAWTKTPMHYLEKDKYLQLKRIVDVTGAKIVLSTSWKEINAWKDLLTDFLSCWDMDVVGTTDTTVNREDEIHGWLNAHPEIESFVILDDFDMSKDFPNNMVQTVRFGQYGLDEEFANKAIEILNKE